MSDATDPRYPVQAPGWAAIDRAVGLLHPGQVPHQFTSESAYDLAGRAPLPAITVWEGRGPDHWLYVTYGLTELFDKSSPRADVSGFGFELTLRLRRDAEEARPPEWPLRLLQGVGHFVLSGHPLDSGHCIDLGGPLTPDGDTALTGLIVVPDPALGKMNTPHGTVLFLAAFGLTADELRAVFEWELRRKVGLVHEVAPALIIDPARPPLAADPKTGPAWRRHALNILLD